MSGHSKWHNIQAKKGKADAARGKIFTKLGRELLIAVKSGGPDPNSNSSLKAVIAKCKANNMPNDTIQNSIKKASGENRTAADVRHAFDKAGGNLGTAGCVSYLFNQKGVLIIDKSTTNLSEDDLMMMALDSGAEDFKAEEEIYEITTDPKEFNNVLDALEKDGLQFLEAGVQMVPTTLVDLDEASGEKMQRLIDNLNDLDDVMNVYSNWNE